jgi:hypothetical protein
LLECRELGARQGPVSDNTSREALEDLGAKEDAIAAMIRNLNHHA